MKSLRVIARLNVGGPARHVVLLDRGLRQAGWSAQLVHGVVAPGEGSLEGLAEAGRVNAVRLAALGPRLHAFSDLRAFWALLKLMFRQRPDVVHTHTAKAGALGRVAAATFNATRRREHRALIVHTFHGHVLDGYFGAVGNFLVRSAERLLARMTDRIVTISARQRADIVERFNIAPANRVVTIPLGLELEGLLAGPSDRSLRGSLTIGPDDFVVGYAGRFVPIKDLPTLMTAFFGLLQEVPTAWLVLAGDGPLRGDLERLAQNLAISSRVHWLGWIDDLIGLYGTMDLCVLSSVNEGTPVAAIEAMAAGRMVIATDVGGVADVIDNGRTGVIVPPRDPASLARAMIEAANDPRRRQRIAATARQEVSARFSWIRLVDDVDRLYRQALAQKRGLIVPMK